MAISLYITDPALLAATVTTQGTAVPDNTKRVVKSMTLYNGTAGAVACEVHVVPSGGTASDTTKIFSRTLASKETYMCPEAINRGINSGGFVQALGLNVSFTYTATDMTNV